MQNNRSPRTARTGTVRWLVAVGAVALGALALPGCHKEHEGARSVTEPPVVKVINPTMEKIKRTVGQPSFVEAYERTSIYPKMTAYLEYWNVDIGDRVTGPKRDEKTGKITEDGQLLAKLFVPELNEEYATKTEMVRLDKHKIQLAKEMVEVAKADIMSAKAKLDETEAILDQYKAAVARWDVQLDRIRREVKNGVVDEQVLTEMERQLRSSVAEQKAAEASIEKAKADLLSRKAAKIQADVAVDVAKALLKVAESEEKRLEKLVGYLDLNAPFTGVITARNANTQDFVLPGKGDITAMQRSPFQSPSGSAPIYVVERTDVVRVFVDIPESDAIYVTEGSRASVLIKAYKDKQIRFIPVDDARTMYDVIKRSALRKGEKWKGDNRKEPAPEDSSEGKMVPVTVTRTAWALNVRSRTLRAEIDLPNTESKILPGMYAYAKVYIERKVLALPVEEKEKEQAISYIDDMTYFWTVDKNGNATRMEIQTGITDGKVIEVTNKRPFPKRGTESPAWQPIDGTEKVLVGDLSLLKEGEPVTLK